MRRRQKGVPTIQDVALRAQVSAATVSRVLSSPERVSIAARKRVDDAVRATGYTVNASARSLRMQRAKAILAVVPGIANAFYSTIIEAVVNEASLRGYGVLVSSRHGDPAYLADYFRSNRADGLLLFDGNLDTSRLHAIAGNSPLLPLVAAYDELPDSQINSVIVDNLQAAERAVQHLFDLGHRRIGHISGLSRNRFPSERLLGYRKAIQDLGLEVRPDWIWPGTYSVDAGIAAGHAYAQMRDRPTAVFASNDQMAIGFIFALRDHGIECPRDVSVIGFDDTEPSEHYSPPLTTMRQPREQIGRLATRALVNLLEAENLDAAPLHLVLTAELVVRKSTSPPAALRAVG